MQLYFTHLMKTGGRSLGWQLRSWFDPERCYPHRSGGDALAGDVQKASVDDLLDLGPDGWAGFDFFSVHMPDWVRQMVAPDHVSLTIVRDPVERTCSHLSQLAGAGAMPVDLAELYDQDAVRLRLANYQVKMLGAPRSWWSGDGGSRRLRARSSPAELSATMDGAARRILFASLATGVPSTATVGRDELRRAVEVLEEIDLVVTTDALDEVPARLEALTGRRPSEIPHLNASRRSDLPTTLLDRITTDNALDLELFDHVRELRRRTVAGERA